MRTVVILIVILLVVLAVGFWFAQRQRTSRLRQRFGDEYDRAVASRGSRREAEQSLAEVAQRRDQLEIRPLSPQQRAAWIQQWSAVQARFVDAPAQAVATARELLPGLMRDRGYPTEGFEERTALLAADHPVVVKEYRAAEEAYQRHLAVGGASTESLRQALVHYRALFEALVEPDGEGPATSSAAVPDGTAPHGRHADTSSVDTTADGTGPGTAGAPVDTHLNGDRRGANR